MSELGRVQVAPSPFSTVIYGLFSPQTDKMKHYSSALYCSADQDMHVFPERIMSKGKKNRAAVLYWAE